MEARIIILVLDTVSPPILHDCEVSDTIPQGIHLVEQTRRCLWMDGQLPGTTLSPPSLSVGGKKKEAMNTGLYIGINFRCARFVHQMYAVNGLPRKKNNHSVINNTPRLSYILS